MKETEITVQVFNEFEEIDKILKNKGFQMIENYQLNDWYFSKIDDVTNLKYIDLMNKSILVREIIDETRTIQLVFKKKELDNQGNVLIEEKSKTKIEDLNSAIKIFNLAGLNNYCKVENNSFVYKNDDVEFVVQIIKDLGTFIEYEENKTMEQMTPKQKFEYMVEVVNTLGLKLGKDYSCKKVFMLLYKNDISKDLCK